jgi:hypothetical protein
MICKYNKHTSLDGPHYILAFASSTIYCYYFYSKLQFGSLLVAYKFYCWFAKMNGFTVRKGQIIKNKAGVVV